MKQQILKGSTDRTFYVFIQDSSVTTGAGLTGLVFNSASLACFYVRPLGSATAVTLATQTVTGAHSDGGFVEVSSANMPGVYRLDLPDAIFASGVDQAVVMLKGAANMAPVCLEFMLTAYNPQSATDLGLSTISTINTNVNTIDDYIDTEIQTIIDLLNALTGLNVGDTLTDILNLVTEIDTNVNTAVVNISQVPTAVGDIIIEELDPGQPVAEPTLVACLALLYTRVRNPLDDTSTLLRMFRSDGEILCEQALSYTTSPKKFTKGALGAPT